MKNFLRTILYLFITTFVYLIFNESAMITFNQGTIFSGTITVISFLAYGTICYFLSRNFEFGRWKYVLFIPFINEIMYIAVIYTTNIRDLLPLEDDNFGLGILLLPLALAMWIIFIVSTFIGILNRKKTILRGSAGI